MDAVNAFNHELFSLMDSKPPISRAKMISITKSAIKAMKLYKHVVQIVEKFIKKCKPEYKVAGLYVVDSIVRQSRHQFGADKDVFGPRFTKNITGTFENLCLCPLEDRSKIVRVLNLWQKNGVFKIEIIQPLLDMAAGNTSAAMPYAGADESGCSPPSAKEQLPVVTANSSLTSAAQLQTSDAFAAVAQLFQSTQGQQLQQMLQNFQQQPLKPESNTQPPPNTQMQGQSIASSLGPSPQPPPLPSQPVQPTTFDKTLLDRFDYDDEPEAGEDTKKDETSSQPTFMQQPPAFPQHTEHFKPHMINMSQEISQQVTLPPNGQPQAFGLPPGQVFPLGGMISPLGHPQMGQPPPGSTGHTGFQGLYPPHNAGPQLQNLSTDIDHSSMRDGRHSRRSHSGSRSPKRRRSRSNSRTRRSRHRRSRSRSRERRHHSPRSRSQERRDRERERERRQRGLPPQKNETLSICSTTLWVGQLDKRTQQQDVACILEEFGQIESINMIPPRGCAYIVMVHRQDAFRALQKLSRGTYKVNQKTIKIAWALNKGIKSDYKQYWDVELGVTYVPWVKVREEDLEELKDGGTLDIDTLAPEWTTTRQALESSEEVTHNGRTEPQLEEIQVVPVVTPTVPPVQIPPAQPPVVALGTVQPPVFPGPMGMPLPSFPSGVPPPFLRPGFNPLQMPPGFIPPGSMPLGPPPSKPEDPPLDPAGLGNRKNEDIPDGPVIFNHQMGPMGNPVIGHHGGPPGGLPGVPHGSLPGVPPGGLLGVPPGGLPPGGLPPGASPGGLLGGPPVGLPGGPLGVPPGALPGGLPGGPPSGLPGCPPGGLPGNILPTGGLLGARPGLIPLQRPPILPPNMQRFPPPQGPRPPTSSAPPMNPQMIHRGPHPQMHSDNPPSKSAFGMPPSHNIRGSFPPQGLGPALQGLPSSGPPPFIRPSGPRGDPHRGDPHRGMDSPDEMDGRHFRGERPAFRDREPERDWDRDRERERDRGLGGGRPSFGDRGRGGERMDGRDRLLGWQEDGDHRGGGWERDRGRDRDRDRRDWREGRSSLEYDRERGRDDGERDRRDGERDRRDRGRVEGSSRDRDRGRASESKDGERPRRSERRERTTRWDNDDRLAELENMDRVRTSDSSGRPRLTSGTDKESSTDPSLKKADSEPLAPKVEDSKVSDGPEPSGLSKNSEKKQETS